MAPRRPLHSVLGRATRRCGEVPTTVDERRPTPRARCARWASPARRSAGAAAHARHGLVHLDGPPDDRRRRSSASTNRSFDPHELWRAGRSTHRVTHVRHRRRRVRAADGARARGGRGGGHAVRRLVAAWSSSPAASCGRRAASRRSSTRGVAACCIDGLGSSEAAGIGMMIRPPATSRRRPSFSSNPSTRVLTEDGRDGGSRARARSACSPSTRQRLPLGYYKDAEKTAATFRVDRRRALLDPRRLGARRGRRHASRCSAAARCASTPAARRSSPRRSRRSLKLHPAVDDCIVVGVPDESWGEAITAVVALAARRRAVERGADRRSRASGSPPTRRRSTSSSSSASCAARPARPTTGWAKETAIRDVATG